MILGQDFGPVGTGDWGLGLGLDNKDHENQDDDLIPPL